MLRSKAPRSAVRWSRRRYILLRMRDDRYRPFDIEELEDKPSLTNEAGGGGQCWRAGAGEAKIAPCDGGAEP
jgi:hypothetical protein